jgi:hypothetical protein
VADGLLFREGGDRTQPFAVRASHWLRGILSTVTNCRPSFAATTQPSPSSPA